MRRATAHPVRFFSITPAVRVVPGWVRAVRVLATGILLAAATSLCAFAVPGEVTNLQFCGSSKNCLQWSSVTGATLYKVYRGEQASLPCDLNPALESCNHGSFGTTTTGATVPENPAVGRFYWFLVTAQDGSGEGTPGTATPGPRQLNLTGSCGASCFPAGQSCSVNNDCCGSHCFLGTCAALCCQPTNGLCTTHADCCSGNCAGNVCQPPCLPGGGSCTQDSQCCSGNCNIVTNQCVFACSVAADCPGADTQCSTRTCTGGACGVSFTPNGTPTNGQSPGDCRQNVCDGSGNIVNIADNNDVPADDGNQCTQDICTNGAPAHPVRPVNSPCNQNGGAVCSASGQCVQCNTSSQCPGADTECQSRTCTANVCGLSFVSGGTPTPSQTPGDCQTRVCDGSGGFTTTVNNGDVPADDGNQCTGETCVNGVPSHPIAPINSPCNQNGGVVCNGSGQCVQCNSASQCPGQDTDCQSRTCTASMCGIAFTSAGTPTPSQTPGDCQTQVCNGSGGTTTSVTDSDVPVDGVQCTDDVCTNGNPSNPPAAAGTPCNQFGGSVCNGSGSCVVPPAVLSTAPADGATVIASTTITVTFTQAMNPVTLTEQTSAGACSGSIQVSLDDFASCISFSAASPTMSGGNTAATLVPQPGLLVNRAYKIRVTTAAQGASGAPLAGQFTQPNGFVTFSPNACDGSLVISQLYGAGGLPGASHRNDFVELHNRGTSSINVNTYSIQYASATGTTWIRTNLTGTIPPGGYYLVQLASGGTNGSVLPAPNATGTTDMATAAGKLALLTNQTTLPLVACPTGLGIIDFIGYGSTANCNEGGANAPSPSSTTSDTRQQAGCLDNNVNGTDFVAVAPNPRNSAFPANVCSCVAMNESGASQESDYCVVQFPSTLSVQTGQSTGQIFGDLFESLVTPPAGPSAIVRAQLGYGLPTANPEYEPGWTWFTGSYNIQNGNNDEYAASFTAPAPGSYRYVYRFSLDQGVSWTYCDANLGDFGAGSNPGLTFDLENQGVLTVTP